jgi:hypothetical protein
MHPLHATVYRNRSRCLDSCAYVPGVITVPPRDVAVLREQERGTERHYRGTNSQWSGHAARVYLLRCITATRRARRVARQVSRNCSDLAKLLLALGA